MRWLDSESKGLAVTFVINAPQTESSLGLCRKQREMGLILSLLTSKYYFIFVCLCISVCSCVLVSVLLYVFLCVCACMCVPVCNQVLIFSLHNSETKALEDNLAHTVMVALCQELSVKPGLSFQEDGPHSEPTELNCSSKINHPQHTACTKGE